MSLNLRAAVRALRRDASFSVLAITLLAITLGTITAVYAVVHAVVLRPFPFANQERVAVIWQHDLRRNLPVIEVAHGEMVDWRNRSRAFQDLAVIGSVNWQMELQGKSAPEIVTFAGVSASFFPVVGATLARGRPFVPGEEHDAAPRAMVIGHGLWERRFGRDPAIVGRTVPVKFSAEGPIVPVQVTGVMQPDFDFPRGADAWLPAESIVRDFSTSNGDDVDKALRWLRIFYVVGRIREGVPLDQARHDLTRTMRTSPRPGDSEPAAELVVTPVTEYLLGPAKPVLWTLLGGAVLMLLVACANVAGLQVSRWAKGQRAHAIRIALGADNRVIMGQAVLESALLSAAAVIGAIGISVVIARALSWAAPTAVPRLETVSLIQAPVLATGGIATLVTLLLCGLWPALVARRLDAVSVLAHGASVAADPRGRRVQRAVVAAQVAIALVLLMGTALFVRTLGGLNRTALGFDPDRLLSITVSPATDKSDRWNTFFDQLITRVETLPIVSSAGAVLLRPLSGPVGWDVQPTLPGEPPRDEGTWSLTPHTNLQIVTPGYFRTMGIRLLRGRLFDAGDRRDTAGVVVVGESAARRLWPGKDPLGQQLRAAYIPHDPKGPPEWQTVIGVVADVRYRGLRDVRLDLYVPNTQSTMHPQHLMVRTRGMPADVVASVRSIAQSLDPGATVSEAELMTDVVAAESAPWRFLMRVFVAFAVLGATLAAVGLAAVVALAVATRRRELSIRAALGADGRRLRTLVAGEALWLVAVGSGVGIVAAVALARSAASVLIGVAPHDVWAILGATSIAAVVGLCACWLPARRAADANPIEALRTE